MPEMPKPKNIWLNQRQSPAITTASPAARPARRTATTSCSSGRSRSLLICWWRRRGSYLRICRCRYVTFGPRAEVLEQLAAARRARQPRRPRSPGRSRSPKTSACAGHACAQAGCSSPSSSVALLGLGLRSLRRLDALHAERALLHHADFAQRDVGVELQLQRLVPGRVEEVEEAHVVRDRRSRSSACRCSGCRPARSGRLRCDGWRRSDTPARTARCRTAGTSPAGTSAARPGNSPSQ